MTGLQQPDVRKYARRVLPRRFHRPAGRFADAVAHQYRFLSLRVADGNVRNLSRRLRSIQGKYGGQRCFVMGNGPSLNLMNLELFGNEYVWGSNKCYLLFDRVNWRPAFYVAVDTRVVPDIAGEIQHLSRTLPETSLFLPLSYRGQGVLRSEPNIYWYNEVRLDETKLPDGVFTRDASRWVSSVRSVTIAALQLAVYLGFNPVYLIGCDTSYSVPPSVQRENGHHDKLVSTRDDDQSHFDPRYFGAGSKWHEPHVDRMIFHYEQAKRACDSLGVTVINATVGGKLEAFPRVQYEDLF